MRVPFFNKYIQNYKHRTGLPKTTVIVSLVFLWAMLLISCVLSASIWMIILLGVVGICVTIHILMVSKPKNKQMRNHEAE
jgi:uncharacterized membrane protein YbaN (DUF454 family)